MINKVISKTILASSLLCSMLAQASWTFSVGPYDLDTTQDACIAEVTTSHNDLTIMFPQDKKSYPLIKMKNKFAREYVGAKFPLTRTSNINFFGTDTSGDIAFYMIPNSAQELVNFLGTLRAKNNISIQKLYVQSGRLQTTTGDFKLNGSSKAISTMQSCLGGTYLSATQENLIAEVAANTNTNGQSLGLDYSEHMQRGQLIFQGLQNFLQLQADKDFAQMAKEQKENDPAYQALLNQKNRLSSEVRGELLKRKTLSDNEDFYANADNLIFDLEQRIATLTADLQFVNSDIDALKVEIQGIEVVLDSLNDHLANQQANFQAQSSIRTSLLRTLNALEREVSQLESSLSANVSQLSNLRSQDSRLRRNRDNALARYQNRAQIRRDIRQSIFDKYRTNPRKIEANINATRNSKEEAQRRATLASQTTNNLRAIKSSGESINGFTKQIKPAQAKIQCMKKAKDEKQIRACLGRVRKVPNPKQWIQQQTQKLNALVAKRNQAIAKSTRLIQGLRLGSLGDRFQSLKRVKNCRASVQTPCNVVATQALKDVQAAARQASDRVRTLDRKLNELSNLRNRLVREMDSRLGNLDNQLSREYDEARRLFTNNETKMIATQSRISNLRPQISRKNRELSDQSARYAAQDQVTIAAQSEVTRARAEITQYKSSVSYNQKVNSLGQAQSKRAAISSELQSEKASLAQTNAKKTRIGNEIGSYPAIKDQIMATISAANAQIDQLAPALKVHEDEISVLEQQYFTAQRAYSLNADDIRVSVQLIRQTF